MDIYTPENMIRFLYKETTPEETATFQAALDTDWTLREKFEELKKSANDLDALRVVSPRPSVVQSIMRYAAMGNEVEQH